MRRRRYLAVVASIGATSLAGCSSLGGGDSDGDSDGDGGGGGDGSGSDSGGESATGGGDTGATGTASADTGTAGTGGGDGESTGTTGGGSGDSGSGSGDAGGGSDGAGDGGDTTGGSDPSGQSGPIAAVRRYYQTTNEADTPDTTEEAVSILEPIVHSQSPIFTLVEQADPSEFTAQGNATILDASIADRDLSTQALQSEHRVLDLPSVSEAAVDAIAGDNAVVEARVEQETATGTVERAETWIVAPEDGRWVAFLNIRTTTSGG